MEVTAPCPQCREWSEVKLQFPATALCPRCRKDFIPHRSDAFAEGGKLDQCPLCGCAHLYRQRDFNRKLGVAILVVGIALAYWTWGISLLAVTLLDAWLYRRVGDVACCYRCSAQFRESTGIAEVEPFKLPLYDYYLNLRLRRLPPDTPPPSGDH